MKIKNEGYVNDSGKKGSTKKIGQGQQGELQKIPYGENTRGRNNDIKGQQGEMRLGLFEEIGQTQMRSPMSPPNIPRPVSMKGKLNKNEVTAKVTQIVPTSL